MPGEPTEISDELTDAELDEIEVRRCKIEGVIGEILWACGFVAALRVTRARLAAAEAELEKWHEAARLTDEYADEYEADVQCPFIVWSRGWSLYDVAHPEPEEAP